jgi:hypothetical protein
MHPDAVNPIRTWRTKQQVQVANPSGTLAKGESVMVMAFYPEKSSPYLVRKDNENFAKNWVAEGDLVEHGTIPFPETPQGL